MKKKAPKHENSERWLLTYSDLITLLMALFVILYASSNVDVTKYKQISASFSEALNIVSTNSGGQEIIDTGMQTGTGEDSAGTTVSTQTATVLTEEEKLAIVKQKVDALINSSDLKGNATTEIAERGLTIRFVDNIIFDSGKADIKPDFEKRLISLSSILNGVENYIRVEGHTDNVAINRGLFTSNWQLSTVRAANVVQFLVEGGSVNPSKLSAVGYGEYRPIKSNDTEDGRAQNRRVDIVILNSKYNDSETKN
jgi:chemotaxis protein MotB